MGKTLYLFVTSERPDQYLNPIVHCVKHENVTKAVLLHIVGSPDASSESTNNSVSVSKSIANHVNALLYNLATRSKYIFLPDDDEPEVDLRSIYEKRWDGIRDSFYKYCLSKVSIENADLQYLDLRESIAQLHRNEPDCLFDVTAVRKTFLGDIFSVIITEGISNLYTFDMRKKPNFDEPWKMLIHDLDKYKYVNIVNTAIYKECSRIIHVSQPPPSVTNTNPIEDELDRLRSERNRYGFLIRLVTGLFVATIGLLVILLLPTAASWQWFAHHPKKLGLQFSAVLIVFGLTWSIIDPDKHRRWFALSSIVVATIIGALQLL